MALDGKETEPVDLTARLLALVGKIVESAGGKVRVALNEEDDSTEAQPEAAHFLKVEDKRLGRDIEIYGFMGEVAGGASAVASFLEEVAIPLKGVLEPDAHSQVMGDVEQLGDEVCPEDIRASWHAIFAEQA
jgi:hypothetical protein